MKTKEMIAYATKIRNLRLVELNEFDTDLEKYVESVQAYKNETIEEIEMLNTIINTLDKSNTLVNSVDEIYKALGYVTGLNTPNTDKITLEGMQKWIDDLNAPNTEQPKQSNRGRGVKQYTKAGQLIGVYPNIITASQATGVSYKNICGCCNDVALTAGNYVWQYN